MGDTKNITLSIVPGVPKSEVSVAFMQGMVDRMAVSFCKYGAVAEAYPGRVDAVKSLVARLDAYASDGNTEWLMDAANFAMIEFMRPSHPRAHYTATDGKSSPGRQWRGEVDRNHLPNRLEDHCR